MPDMKCKWLLLLPIFFVLSMSSCSDSLQSLNDEHTELLEAKLDVIMKFEKGAISEVEAVQQFEELVEKTEQLNARYIKFHEKRGKTIEGEWYTANEEKNKELYYQIYRAVDRFDNNGRLSERTEHLFYRDHKYR